MLLSPVFLFANALGQALIDIMKQFKLNVISRPEIGRGPARRLRKSGRIPASLYGKKGARSISVLTDDFRRLNKQAAGSAAMIELLDDEGKKHLALIQETHIDPITDGFLHIDFHEVEQNETFTATVPVQITGEETSIGVRNESGLIDQHVYELEIRCKPADLPEAIVLDVTDLHVGDGIHLRDVSAPSGVELFGDPDTLIVACAGSRIAKVAGSTADAEDEAAAVETAEAASAES
jgi:large subunit ribosomal protein L25